MNGLKLQKIGNSAGFILPKDLIAHLDIEVGQVVSFRKTPKGLELLASDADFDKQMAVAREVMARRRRALRELAK